VFIHHYGSRSFIGNKIDYSSALSGNKRIFSNKWSGIDAKSPLGNKLQVVNALDKALELNHRGSLEKAVEALLEGIRCAPESKNLYYILAEMLINEKQFKDALNVLTELLPNDDDVQRLSLAAYCEEGLGSDEQAEQYAQRVLALNPSYAQSLNLLGVLAHKKKELSAALNFFEKAAVSDPGYGDPYTNMGIMSWSADRNQEALALLERGFILSPTIADNLAAYHAAVTEAGDLARLEQVLREARSLHPLNRRLVFLFIDTLIKEKKYDAAIQEIEQAMMLFGIEDDLLAAAIDVRNKIVPQNSTMKFKHKNSLSLCMIVKNEERYLPKCLMSVKPVVDEIIVVDTGSTDRTRDIARAFGATVYDVPWTGDFSEARNCSLAKASGNWILVLDGDEAVSSLDHEKLRNLVNKTNGKKIAYSLLTRNYVTESDLTGWTANEGAYPAEEAGTGWAGSVKVRLFPRDSRIAFVNPVHELVEPSLKKIGIPVKESGISIHHYGKLDWRKSRSKGEEYYRLGRKKLEENGESASALQELAIQAGELNKYDEALDLWKCALQIQPDMAPAHLNMSSIYLKLDRYSEALAAIQKAVELAPRMREALCSHALCELYAGNASKAVSILQDLIDREPNYPSATILLAMVYCCDGKKDLGLDLFEKLPGNKSSLVESIQRVAGKLRTAGQAAYAASLVGAVSESGYVNDGLLCLGEKSREQLVRQ
jgi:tetratricopeptide (TPR) repeat protein